MILFLFLPCLNFSLQAKLGTWQLFSPSFWYLEVAMSLIEAWKK